MKRITFLDHARGFAIILALTIHAMGDFGVNRLLNPDVYFIIKFITTSATPTFIVLFGIMLELVYVRKLKENGTKSIFKKFIKRSFLCYVAYVLCAISEILAGWGTTEDLPSKLLFLSKVRFSDILMFYIISLLVAPLLMILRAKFGLKSLILLVIATVIIHIQLQTIPADQFPAGSERLLSVTLGIQGTIGPSVLTGIYLIVVGMILGNSLIKFKEKLQLTPFYKTSLAILVPSLFVVVILSMNSSFKQVLDNYIGVDRANNNLTYFIIGSVLAIINIMLFLALSKVKPFKAILSLLFVFGQASLYAYALGTILLNLVLYSLSASNLREAVILVVSFILIVWLILGIYKIVKAKLSKKNAAKLTSLELQ